MTNRMAVGLVYIWLVSLPLLSIPRVKTWSNEYRLWAAASWWSPEKLRPLVQMGVLTRSPEMLERAVRTFANGQRPIEWAGCAVAVENLARVLSERGRYAEAVKWSSYRCDGPLSW